MVCLLLAHGSLGGAPRRICTLTYALEERRARLLHHGGLAQFKVTTRRSQTASDPAGIETYLAVEAGLEPAPTA